MLVQKPICLSLCDCSCVCRWPPDGVECFFLLRQTLRMNCLESCWTGPLEALNHWVQKDFSLNQYAMVCNKHRRALFNLTALFQWVACSIKCCINLLCIYISHSSLDKICMPQSVNRNMRKDQDSTGKLFKLTVSLSKLPESPDPHSDSIDLGTTDVHRKPMYSKWNQSSETVKTHRKQKPEQRNKHQNIAPSVHIESRQNSQKRRKYIINIYCCY